MKRRRATAYDRPRTGKRSNSRKARKPGLFFDVTPFYARGQTHVLVHERKRWERSRFHMAIYQRKCDFVAGKGREKLTKEGIEDALRLCRVGMTDKDIAAYLGVAPETYSRWINHPRTDNQRQLCQAMKKGEVERKATLVGRIMDASGDSWQAAAWLLERKYPQEYAKRSASWTPPTRRCSSAKELVLSVPSSIGGDE